MLNTIDKAINDLKAGKMIIVIDHEERENEGDFICACETITSEQVNFMLKYGKGLICAPISKEIATRLELPPMVEASNESMGTAFTVSIDAKNDITTGISAADRMKTLRLLGNPSTRSADFVRPGHIFPLVARDGGVLERDGHTEASVDLMKLAGFKSAAVICEILNDDGSCARLPELVDMAKEFGLSLISIDDLKDYISKNQ